MKWILALCTLSAVMCAATERKPDFAFPIDVVNYSDSLINAAADKPLNRVVGVMAICTAKSQLSGDSAYVLPKFIGQQAQAAEEGVARGMLLLYQAETETNIYAPRQSKYDAVQAPLTPYPDDLVLWSGTQFKQHIKCLTDSAIIALSPFFDEPLDKFADVVDIPNDCKAYYPKLRDFVFERTITMMQRIGEEEYAARYISVATSLAPVGTLEWAHFAALDRTSLRSAYNAHPQGAAGAYLLCELLDHSLISNEEAVQILRERLSDPTADDGETRRILQSRYDRLTRASASLNGPTVVAPSTAFDITIQGTYVSYIGYAIYKASDIRAAVYDARRNFYTDKYSKLANCIPIASDTIHTCVENAEVSHTFTISGLPAGTYAVIPTFGGQPDTFTAKTFYVSELTPVAVSQGNSVSIAVVKTADGTPVKDVLVTLTNRYALTPLSSRTDKDGFADLKFPDNTNSRSYGVSLTANGVVTDFGSDFSLYQHRKVNYNNELHAYITTSAPIYHPGDTIQWSVLATKIEPEARIGSALSGKNLKVVLINANDTIDVTTDQYGRASGFFVAPTGMLTGRYRIGVLDEKRYIGTSSVQVFDFKAAAIEITDAVSEQQDGKMIISGKVTTLSGMAVSEAEISFDVSSYVVWFRRKFIEPRAVYIPKVKTDSQGRFSAEIPMTDFEDDFVYTVKIIATDAVANTAESSVRFAVGKPYGIRQSGGSDIVNSDDNSLPIVATRSDGKGEITPIDVHFEIRKGTESVLSGTASVGKDKTDIDLSALPVGDYTTTLTPVDTALCDPFSYSFSTYSVKRNAVASSIAMVVPTTEYKVGSGETANITIGLPDKSTIVVFECTKDSIQTRYSKKLKAGFTQIPIGLSEGKVVVAICRDGKVTNATITISEKGEPEPELVFENIRDNLIPGSNQRWRIHFRRQDGTPLSGAVLAMMYNHSLDFAQAAFTNFPTKLLPDWSRYSQFVSFNDVRDSGSGNLMAARSDIFGFSTSEPQFIYADNYGYSVVDDLQLYMSAGPSRSVRMNSMDGAAEQDSAVEEAVVETTNAAVKMSDTEPAEESEPEQWREGETYSALWLPTFTTDEEGYGVIEFTLPEDNTTWRLYGYGWTEQLCNASLNELLTAAKPIIAKPNIPRFLRQGDEATISAVVYNNCDTTATITTAIEIIDLTDNRVLNKAESVMTVDPTGNVVVPIDVVAPETSALGYRVRACSGNYIDSEIDVIPILEASTLLIESECFYLTDEEPRYSKDLGVGVTTLQYCESPIWEVVKALPGQYNHNPFGAAECSRAIFAALTAKGLLRDFPEIGKAITAWSENPADSALVSKLYKNENLKLATLAQTPWQMRAATMTRQMQQLAVTFDKDEISTIVNTAVAKLASLQNPDGGIRYGSWQTESSPYVTASVLTTIGRLNASGYLERNNTLDEVINKAFSYLDNHTKDMEMLYAYVYSLYPTRTPSTLAGKQAINNAINQALKNWKKASTTEKARYALLLHANKHDATARQIISSLRQFEIASPIVGISFPSVKNINDYATILEAFSAIDPRADELDKMRQWLIVRTQVTDNLGAYDPTLLIGAILTTNGTDTRSVQPDITLDGSPLEISKVEQYTGTIAQDLTGGSLVITHRQGGILSYGSLTRVFTSALDSVAARDCEGVSIRKRLLVNDNGIVSETTSPTIGQRVTVQLIITTDRDLEYVTIDDARAATFEPTDQVPGYVHTAAASFYRENTDSRTRLFINYLRKGTYVLTYDVTATYRGTFCSGPATIQSQYAPEITARSNSHLISVK